MESLPPGPGTRARSGIQSGTVRDGVGEAELGLADPITAVMLLNDHVALLHYRDLQLSSTLSMAREFISDYTVAISRDRIVVPELVEKSTFLSSVRNELFKN